jgi:excisionase family DNA binding protein
MSPSVEHGDGTSGPERLFMPGEVADLFRVDPKTVTRWAASGRIDSVQTPGGHYRIPESAVRDQLRPARQRAAQHNAAPLPVKASQ